MPKSMHGDRHPRGVHSGECVQMLRDNAKMKPGGAKVQFQESAAGIKRGGTAAGFERGNRRHSAGVRQRGRIWKEIGLWLARLPLSRDDVRCLIQAAGYALRASTIKCSSDSIRPRLFLAG